MCQVEFRTHWLTLSHIRFLNRMRLLLLFSLIITLAACDSNNSVAPTPGGNAERWVLQSPYPTDRALFSVYFISEDSGWIAGSGIILHTTDGGGTWETQIKNDDESYRDIVFADANNGWAVGKTDIIRHTPDGGKTWILQESGINAPLFTSIFVHDSVNAITVGYDNSIVQTTDGGQNWVQRTSPADSYHDIFEGIYFLTSQKGWIVGHNGTVLCSNDSGVTWSMCSGITGGVLTDAIFFDSLNGYVYTTPGYVMKTVNGGVNWSTLHYAPGWLHGMSFTDSLNGWIVGERGLIQHTPDGGETWETQVTTPPGLANYYYDIFFLNSQIGWVVGGGGIILKTIDGGQDWNLLSKGTQANLFATEFIGNRGWSVGQKGTILATTNGGDTWQQQEVPTQETLNGVDFVDSRTGWAVGNRGVILHTDNAGRTWVSQYSSIVSHILALQFIDDKNGWAVGGGGNILKTANGGEDWIVQYHDSSTAFYSVFFLSDLEGWVAGYEKLLHTTDGGVSWEKPSNFADGMGIVFRDICFLDPQKGFALTDPSVLFYTNDGGETWDYTLLKYGDYYVYAYLYSIEFVDDQFGWIVGEELLGRQAVIYYTQDGGHTWLHDDFITANGLYDVHFNNRREGWIVGENGMIIHTDQGDR